MYRISYHDSRRQIAERVSWNAKCTINGVHAEITNSYKKRSRSRRTAKEQEVATNVYTSQSEDSNMEFHSRMFREVIW